MSSEAQVLANRCNAEKSTGPRTTQGKAAVAQNAIKHGLLARRNLVMGEDPQEFERHRAQMLGELAPAGVMESTLAERIVSLSWRLKRAERIQNEAFDYLLAEELKRSMSDFYDELSPKDEERMRSDPYTDPGLAVGRTVVKDVSQTKVLDHLLMYERRIESSLYKTMAELQKLRLMRNLDPAAEEPAAKPCSARPDDRLRETKPISGAADTLNGGDCLATLAMTSCETKPTSSNEADGVHGTPYKARGQSCETNPISGTPTRAEPTMEPVLAGAR